MKAVCLLLIFNVCIFAQDFRNNLIEATMFKSFESSDKSCSLMVLDQNYIQTQNSDSGETRGILNCGKYEDQIVSLVSFDNERYMGMAFEKEGLLLNYQNATFDFIENMSTIKKLEGDRFAGRGVYFVKNLKGITLKEGSEFDLFPYVDAYVKAIAASDLESIKSFANQFIYEIEKLNDLGSFVLGEQYCGLLQAGNNQRIMTRLNDFLERNPVGPYQSYTFTLHDMYNSFGLTLMCNNGESIPTINDIQENLINMFKEKLKSNSISPSTRQATKKYCHKVKRVLNAMDDELFWPIVEQSLNEYTINDRYELEYAYKLCM